MDDHSTIFHYRLSSVLLLVLLLLIPLLLLLLLLLLLVVVAVVVVIVVVLVVVELVAAQKTAGSEKSYYGHPHDESHVLRRHALPLHLKATSARLPAMPIMIDERKLILKQAIE